MAAGLDCSSRIISWNLKEFGRESDQSELCVTYIRCYLFLNRFETSHKTNNTMLTTFCILLLAWFYPYTKWTVAVKGHIQHVSPLSCTSHVSSFICSLSLLYKNCVFVNQFVSGDLVFWALLFGSHTTVCNHYLKL